MDACGPMMSDTMSRDNDLQAYHKVPCRPCTQTHAHTYISI